MKQSQFEKNGGYFIDGVAYMDCKITGEPVKNVSTDCKEVIGSRALTGLLHKKFPDTNKPSYKPPGRPAGWHWMKEFVDKDYPWATWCGDNGIHVGTHRFMSQDDIDRINTAIGEFFHE